MRVGAFNGTATQNNIFCPNPVVLDSLRSQIHQIERSGKLSQRLPAENELTISLGNAEINEALP